MRLAAFQMEARAGDVAANLSMISDAAAEAKAAGAALMVAPELATTGYGAGDVIRELAEPDNGDQVRATQELAARHQIMLTVGFPERADGRIYNSAVFAHPEGWRKIYRKCQIYGEYERDLFEPGDQPPTVFSIGSLKVGILICFDVEFPEMVRSLAVAGADLVLVPTAQPDTPDAAFIAEKIVPVRAFENGIAIVCADHAGRDSRFAYAGRSCIALPDGSDGARAPAFGSCVIVADYEPSAFVEARLANPYLAERRFDFPIAAAR